jgi:hypothetical protein
MIALIRLLLVLLATPFRSKLALEAENAALRQQIIVLRRKLRGRIRLSNGDRLFFVWLYRLFPAVTRALLIIRPDTLVRWHRAGFRYYWRWKSRRRIGRPKIEYELRALIRRMNAENPLWGAPRIHGELLKLGFEVAQSTVAKYMVKRRGPPSQTWRTFLRNHAPDIAAIDLFVVPTISFGLLYGLIVVRIARRKLVWVNGHAASHSGVGCPSIDRGVPVGGSAATSHPRSRCHLWKRRSESPPLNGHTGSSHRTAIALAEPAC